MIFESKVDFSLHSLDVSGFREKKECCRIVNFNFVSNVRKL